MNIRKRWVAGVALLGATALAVPAIVVAGPGSSADVRFGNSKAGSPFPPAEHDSSFNGEDNVIPRTVVISAGGTVSFTVDGFHWPVLYRPGTSPEDILVPDFPPEENIFINDFGSAFVAGAPGPVSWTSPPLTQRGRYLMICNVTPHFAFAKMYGYVQVM